MTQKEEFEQTCSVFIDAVNHYFGHLTDSVSKVGIPYMKSQDDLLLSDFTGMIGISGSRKGFLYISGNRALYGRLIQEFLGQEESSDEDVLDMAGELANVVAGNLRETYGSEFMISVPIVFEGMPKKMKFPENVSIYVIPIEWKQHCANMVIGIA